MLQLNTGHLPPANTGDLPLVLEDAVKLAHHWRTESAEADVNDSQTEQLAELLRHENGVRFTMDFVDRVMRPESRSTAARALASITRGEDISFLGALNAGLAGLGAAVGPVLPHVVVPAARAHLRQQVSHLVLDAESKALDDLLSKAAEKGEQLNLNLLGEAVLGDEEARDRAARTLALIEKPQVTYVSIKASSMVAQLNHWDYEGCVDAVIERIRPLYRAARDKNPRVFLNLDMEEYSDLHLTLEVFTRLLSEEEFHDLEAGIVLQAYLPDSLGALEYLAEFARKRVEAGGAKIRVRLVKGANLSMEHVHAEIAGWRQAPYGDKESVDANYYRLLDYILQPEFADALDIGLGSHNLFTLAMGYKLAKKRGVERMVHSEMLQGMSPAQQKMVREVFGSQVLYTPVVGKDDFDVAVSYLVRRLEENAAPQNFIHAVYAPKTPDHDPIADQEQVFREAVADRWEVLDGPNRTQDRRGETAREIGGESQLEERFINEPDTDSSLPANRDWAAEALAHPPQVDVGEEITDPGQVGVFVDKALAAQGPWESLGAEQRAEILEEVGDEIASRRGDFISVSAHEAGKTIDQSDPEISEAIDFFGYYAESARRLADVGADFHPNKLTVVVPPWNFPVAIPAGGVAAALAAGSAVIIKPAPQVVRCAKLIVDAIHAVFDRRGISRDTVQYVRADEGEAGKALISHEAVDAIVLTGASETAELFYSWDPKLNIMAETSGKNGIVITPAADPDLAVEDLYQSAFLHSGQKCSAASLAILVGDAGKSERIKRQLVDAASTLVVGPGTDISSTMNGLIEPPGEKLERGLTRLEPGESWLLEPRKLDEEGKFWTPGIRDNVEPGSWFHTNECFGPVLGIMYAKDLDEAIEIQNSTGYGLTAGIHTLDGGEINTWLEKVEAGNVYVNRGITGAIVQRQPFGGWKKSSVGPGAKAGGPNYVAQMGTWTDKELPALGVSLTLPVTKVLEEAKQQVGDGLSEQDYQWLVRAAEYDQRAWDNEFGREHDFSALESEANIFRYRRALEPVVVYLGTGHTVRDLYRQELASAVTGTPITVVADGQLPEKAARVRLLGEGPDELYGDVSRTVFDGPVLADGRRELLPYLHEQAVSATLHRFGVLRDPAGLRD